MAVIRVHRREGQQGSAAADELRDELAGELARDAGPDEPMRQPIVIEDELTTQTLHVAVIWDKWRRITAGERSAVILSAYERAAPGKVDRITIALPATTEEAVSLGMLPYAVRPAPYPTGSDPAAILAAIRAEGATESPDGPVVLAPTREAANGVIRRLAARTALQDWFLEHSMRVGVDSSMAESI